MKLSAALKQAYYWVKALKYAARESWADALVYIDKCSFHDEEVCTLKALCLFALDQDGEAYSECAKALQKISESNESAADKHYLENYVMSLMSDMNNEAYVYPGINFALVSKSLLRNFPMPGHHDWGKA